MIELLMEYDCDLNDIADHEYNRTPLIMILANKEIITNPICEENVAKTIEFFSHHGAVFDADEREKSKIRKRLEGIHSRSVVQGFIRSVEEDCSITPIEETIAMNKSKFKTVMEDENAAKTTYGCWFSSCQ